MRILKKFLKKFYPCAIILASVFLIFACSSSSNEKKVGIILPLENKALDEIAAGFKETLLKNANQPIQIKIANAQGDLNLQRAIISQMKSEHFDIIAPIGTAATQMTLSMVKQQPIVSLAANYTQDERSALTNCNLAVVKDEISPQQIIKFIHQVYPQITRLTLIHSGTEKIYADVKIAVASGKNLGITVTPMMAPTLNDLYSVANSLPRNTQGILILKDILIASGIATLTHTAQNLHIPLIAADQGSVQEGAAFALGVYEKNIGVEGGLLANKILQGKSACSLPIVEMTKLNVFVNQSSLKKEGLSLDPIKDAASRDSYQLTFTDRAST